MPRPMPGAGRRWLAALWSKSMNAAGYTYVRVDLGDGEVWVASNRFSVEVGDRVTFPLETPMMDFHSESLDRDFSLVYFVSYVVPEGETPQTMAPAATNMPPGHPSLDAETPTQSPLKSPKLKLRVAA